MRLQQDMAIFMPLIEWSYKKKKYASCWLPACIRVMDMTAFKNAEVCGYVMHRSHLVVEGNAPDASVDAGISKQERRSRFPGDFQK